MNRDQLQKQQQQPPQQQQQTAAASMTQQTMQSSRRTEMRTVQQQQQVGAPGPGYSQGLLAINFISNRIFRFLYTSLKDLAVFKPKLVKTWQISMKFTWTTIKNL